MNEGSKPRFTAAEIARQIGGTVEGDSTIELSGFAPADAARKGDLTFAESETWFARAQESAASAILVGGEFKSSSKTLIRVTNARVAFAKVLPLFFPEPTFIPGVHPSAVIHPTAQIAHTAHV